MFLPYARDERQPTANALWSSHPKQVLDLVEYAWASRTHRDAPRLEDLPDPMLHSGALDPSRLRKRPAGPNNEPPEGIEWQHLIYAYMVENTRIYEIIARVVRSYLEGEALGPPSVGLHNWLRTTELLLYSRPSNDSALCITSSLRPDVRAVRRNAYFRMFGMDLLHGTDDNKKYPFVQPRASNGEFATTLSELLREVWVGISNSGNTSGKNPIDDAAIHRLVAKLKDMLQDRRKNGNLRREEFASVVTLSWLHLAVEFDSQLVIDLSAEANTAAERLRKIGQRVGLPPPSKTGDFFALSELLAEILREVENGRFDELGDARLLYSDDSNSYRKAMTEVINHWASATGQDIKQRRQVEVKKSA